MTYVERRIVCQAEAVGETVRVLARETGKSPKQAGIIRDLAVADAYVLLVKTLEDHA